MVFGRHVRIGDDGRPVDDPPQHDSVVVEVISREPSGGSERSFGTTLGSSSTPSGSCLGKYRRRE
jgi:hypothetical protein